MSDTPRIIYTLTDEAPFLATASLLMMGVGLVAWVYLHHRWPEIGRTVQ